MTPDDDALASTWPEIVRQIQARTPARLLVGRSGGSYRTSTQLRLRADHAAAVDSVRTELDVERDLGAELVARFRLFEVCTKATSKSEYLMRPDLARSFSGAAQSEILQRCESGADLQIVIGDGLSVRAVSGQVPALLPLLEEGAAERGWKLGQSFVVRHCRVGVLNEVGGLLHPKVVALLIGERPGLSTAESLSAYLAFQPRPGHTDADRNLVSNIHRRGVSPQEAVVRIVNLAALMMSIGRSGSSVKEQLPLPTTSRISRT